MTTVSAYGAGNTGVLSPSCRLPTRAVVPAVVAPLLVSRVIVWAAAIVSWLVAHHGYAFDPTGVTRGLGHFGNIIGAPAVRWDAVWYLSIAQHGYAAAPLTNFFPLYPLTVRGLGFITQSLPVAGVLVSLAATAAALWVIFRLVELELSAEVARRAVWLITLFPMSFFLSAVYTEGLFLALSAAGIYAARLGRWRAAGQLGACAAATRNVGLLLILPLLVFRAAQVAARDGDAGARERLRQVLGGQGLWILVVPLGTIAYMVALGLIRGTPFEMFSGHEAHRAFMFFPLTVIHQIRWSVHELHTLLAAGHHGFGLLYSGVPELLFLALALVCAVGTWRRLHPAYTAYAVAALLVFLSEPEYGAEPLASFPRYILPLFPLWIWLARTLGPKRSWPVILAISGLLLVVFTGQFATWHFVA